MNTHQINPHSTYSKGHLDPENHKNVMNCTYYIVFEQNYKNVQWWNDKKARIQKQIETNDEEQMKVNTCILTAKLYVGNFSSIAIKLSDCNKKHFSLIIPLYNIFSLIVI